MSCSNDGGGGGRKEEEMLSSFPPIHTDTRTKKQSAHRSDVAMTTTNLCGDV